MRLKYFKCIKIYLNFCLDALLGNWINRSVNEFQLGSDTPKFTTWIHYFAS